MFTVLWEHSAERVAALLSGALCTSPRCGCDDAAPSLGTSATEVAGHKLVSGGAE